MPRVDLMRRYPKSNRSKYLTRSLVLTAEEQKISKSFGFEYFDGERKFGLGGYYYDPKFFKNVVSDMIDFYDIDQTSKILDVGAAKGFMLYDFMEALPGVSVTGLDISDYAIEHALPSVKPFLVRGSCDDLPFPDDSFDLVVSIATIHNMDLEGVKKSLKEIMRVSRGKAFIKVNGYSNESDKRKIEGWNIVANTTLHEDEWVSVFEETNYTGDYDFFVP